MTDIIRPPCDESIVHAQPCHTPCPRQSEPWVLAATILGSSMAFIDSTAVNVALPTLQNQLDATVSEVQWVVESYALMLGALILVGGSLGDRFGRRRIFVVGVVLFALASIGCAAAADVRQLIIARGAQGIGGALLIPGSLAIISASFAASDRGRAIGLWSGFTAITSAIGPVLGGWLVESFSWRWIFWMNLPLALVIVAISLAQVPESHDPAANQHLDWWGTWLTVLGLGSVIFGLLESANLGLGNPWIIAAIAVGILLLLAFIVVETRVSNPMMPLRLFASRTFAGANLVTLLLYAALGGVLFFLPFNLIQVQGYSATAAGAALVPFPVMMFFLSRWSGGLASRYGARRPLMVGPAIAALGFGLMIVPQVGGSYWLTFFPAIVVLGLGMAVSVAPLTTAVMEAVATRFAGTASGINNAVSRVASLLAIALLGIVMLRIFSTSLRSRLEQLDLTSAIRQQLIEQSVNLAATPVPPGLSSSVSQSVEQAINLAFVDGFRGVMGIAVALAIASSLVAGLMITPPSKMPQ